MLFNIFKIATLVCASAACVKAVPLADASDVVVPEDNALSQLAEQIITIEAPTYNVSTPATLEARDIGFTNCGCAKSGLKYWHADMDKVINALAYAGDFWFKDGESRFFDPRTVGLTGKIGFYMKNPPGARMQLIPSFMQRLATDLKHKRDTMSCGNTGYNIYCENLFVSVSFYAL